MCKHLKDAEAGAVHLSDLATMDREVLVICGMDRDGLLLSEQRIVGTKGAVICRPRDLLPELLAAGATHMILAHNHPSGRTAPSSADLAFTQRVRDAARIFDVHLIDHVIIAKAGWLSLTDSGWMEASNV